MFDTKIAKGKSSDYARDPWISNWPLSIDILSLFFTNLTKRNAVNLSVLQ